MYWLPGKRADPSWTCLIFAAAPTRARSTGGRQKAAAEAAAARESAPEPEYVERIGAITLDEANQAVRRRIPSDDLLIVVVGTASEIGDAVREVIPNLASTEIVPFDRDA